MSGRKADTLIPMGEKKEGIITKGVGGTYSVRCPDGEMRLCQIRGGIRRSGMIPLVGDKVITGDSGDPDIPFVIERILTRKNFLVRPPLANIDNLFLVFSCADPSPDLKLLDKMLIICSKLDIRPVVLFSKRDMDPDGCDALYRIYSEAGINCMSVSRDTGPDTEFFSAITSGCLSGFAGPSGVGKSTICNILLGNEISVVGEISERLKRGKHTTRHVELFEYGDGFITDTPGFTSLDLFDVGVIYNDVAGGYPEIQRASLECRFDDCRHIRERDCNVRAMTGKGIDEGRYGRYREFYEYLYERRPNNAGGYR